MISEYYIPIIGYIFGFYMAWNIGANDVANSMASAVGAKAITIRQTVYSKRLWEKNRPLIHGLPCWLQSFLQLFWTMLKMQVTWYKR